MQLERPIGTIGNEAGSERAVVRRAPPVTAHELLGGMPSEISGLDFADRPIHGFYIEQAGKQPEVVAVMERTALDSGRFHDLLYSVAPNKEGGDGDFGTLDDWNLLNSDHQYHDPDLITFHQRLGKNWTIFAQHFPLLYRVLQEDHREAIDSIMEKGTKFMDDFTFHGFRMSYEDWHKEKDVRLSRWTSNDCPEQALVVVRPGYEKLGYDIEDDEEDENPLSFWPDDKRRIPIGLALHGAKVKITIGEETEALADKWGDYTRVEDFATANVVVPVFRFTSASAGRRHCNLDPLPEDVLGVQLDEQVAALDLPADLTLVSQRFNPLVGLLAAAYLSPEITAKWPAEKGIGDSKLNMMGPAQVPLLAIMKRKQLTQAPIIQALDAHVSQHAA